jgi:F-type H+-transporting ATPase subunit epsilon
MGKDFVLEIISPEGSTYKGTVDQVTLPSIMGEITVLPGHAPLFTSLSDGEIVIRRGQESTSITIAGGFLEVAENHVNVIANFAIKSDEIVARQAEEAKQKAETALKQHKDRVADLLAERDLRKSAIELKIADKLRKRPKKTG